MSMLGLSQLLLLSVAFASHDATVKRSAAVLAADGQVVMRRGQSHHQGDKGEWQPSTPSDSQPKSSGIPWPSPTAVVKVMSLNATNKTAPKGKEGGGSVGPNNLKEAEAEAAKFFKMEELVAKETGLPLNSSAAAEREMDEEIRKEEEEEEEEETRVDLLYASMIVCLILVAGLAYYRWRQSRQTESPQDEAVATGTSK
eukprot:Skav207383  [mRNA]  locus=scaffold2496:270817:271413:+ [translate_table: standard]